MDDHKAEPASVGVQPIWGERQREGRGFSLQVGEAEIRSPHHRGHARAIEEVGVTLRRGKDARGLPIALAEMTISSPGDQPACAAAIGHGGKHLLEARWR